MEWFRHDSNANLDDKLQEVLLDYGLEGYGLYWYCIELIVGKTTSENITFELKHDARIIARNTGSTPQKVEEMMKKFIALGLFENTDGKITCLKVAKRLMSSATSNPQMRNLIKGIKTHHDDVMTLSDKISPDKNRLDKNRIDIPSRKVKTTIPKDFTLSENVIAWAKDKGHTNLDKHLECFILACNAKGYTYIDWDSAFMGAVRNNWAKLDNTIETIPQWKAKML